MHSLTAEREEEFARKMAKMGDPIRLRIICFLCRNEKSCVTDIAKAFNIPLANVSHHLRTLADAGVLQSVREGKTICYMLSNDQFALELKKFISQLKIAYTYEQ